LITVVRNMQYRNDTKYPLIFFPFFLFKHVWKEGEMYFYRPASFNFRVCGKYFNFTRIIHIKKQIKGIDTRFYQHFQILCNPIDINFLLYISSDKIIIYNITKISINNTLEYLDKVFFHYFFPECNFTFLRGI